MTVANTGMLSQLGVFLGPLWEPLSHISNNIVSAMSAIPGMLLSPLWFFAVFLPLFYGFQRKKGPGESLLVTMLIYSFIVVLLFRYDIIFLLSMLIPVHMLGSAAVVAYSTYLRHQFEIHRLHVWLVGFLSIFFVFLSGWRAVDTEMEYAPFRAVAEWLRSNVSRSEVIAGDGYGYVATTGFLSGHRTVSRFWDRNPKGVVEFLLSQNARWLVIYEAYLSEVNPEVLSILDDGLPGMKLKCETTDRHHHRIQVYQVADGNASKR